MSDFPNRVATPISTKQILQIDGLSHIRAVYTRENKPRLSLAAGYVSRERNYLYEYKLPGQDKPRLEKVVNIDFVPFIRCVRGLRKPRPARDFSLGPATSFQSINTQISSNLDLTLDQ